jgi:hypothetical protein
LISLPPTCECKYIECSYARHPCWKTLQMMDIFLVPNSSAWRLKWMPPLSSKIWVLASQIQQKHPLGCSSNVSKSLRFLLQMWGWVTLNCLAPLTILTHQNNSFGRAVPTISLHIIDPIHNSHWTQNPPPWRLIARSLQPWRPLITTWPPHYPSHDSKKALVTFSLLLRRANQSYNWRFSKSLVN